MLRLGGARFRSRSTGEVKTVEGREFTLGLKDGKVSVDGANVVTGELTAP